MIGKHDVMLGEKAIGQVTVTQQGLYYRISCNCRLSGSIVYILVANWDNKSEKLGVLVPVAGGFCVDTKLPTKRAGEGQVCFRVIPKHEKMPETFIPIRAEEPFAYLAQLENAYLQKTADGVGVLIRETPGSSPPGSDQTP